MKVTAIETIRVDEFPNLLWVQVHTDEGLVGLGETFYGPEAAEAHIHGIIATALLGRDPRNVEGIQGALTGYIGFSSASAEMRGRSAIDIALWDILGQAANLPLCDLLGGRVREQIKVYNTCAGYSYVQTRPTQGTDNFGLDAKKGQYEDLDAFLNRADELALSLLEQGIDAMKIWPLDYAAEASQGYWISPADLKKGPAAVREDPQGLRRQDGCRLRAALAVEPPAGHQDRPGAGGLRADVGGGPGVHGAHDLDRRGGARDALTHRRRRDARGPCRLPLPARAGSPVDGHHGRHLVRRRLRGQEDRHHGRALPDARRLPRLHRAGGAHGVDAPGAQYPQLLGAGDGARLLLRLVPPLRHRAAARHQRHDHRAQGAGPRHPPRSSRAAARRRQGPPQHRQGRSSRQPPPSATQC